MAQRRAPVRGSGNVVDTVVTPEHGGPGMATVAERRLWLLLPWTVVFGRRRAALAGRTSRGNTGGVRSGHALQGRQLAGNRRRQPMDVCPGPQLLQTLHR